MRNVIRVKQFVGRTAKKNARPLQKSRNMLAYSLSPRCSYLLRWGCSSRERPRRLCGDACYDDWDVAGRKHGQSEQAKSTRGRERGDELARTKREGRLHHRRGTADISTAQYIWRLCRRGNDAML